MIMNSELLFSLDNLAGNAIPNTRVATAGYDKVSVDWGIGGAAALPGVSMIIGANSWPLFFPQVAAIMDFHVFFGDGTAFVTGSQVTGLPYPFLMSVPIIPDFVQISKAAVPLGFDFVRIHGYIIETGIRE
jgi:hypothetical protein